MTDSEAIKQLKRHHEFLKHTWKPHPDYDVLIAIGNAIYALEKQEQKKPVDQCMFMECPRCRNVEIQNMKYCPNCGQKLDWGEENDD